jgi:hypothetical protein
MLVVPRSQASFDVRAEAIRVRRHYVSREEESPLMSLLLQQKILRSGRSKQALLCGSSFL